MLDTIVIKLERDDFIIHDPAAFTPHADIIYKAFCGHNGITKCYYNPKVKNKYLPRATLFKKPWGPPRETIWLNIEFSAPKLIFGNNFEELNEGDDLDAVIKILHESLIGMGIETTHNALINAKVTAIHYSKNIMLDQKTPCHLLIQTLEKADMNGRLDMNQSDFRNGGQMAKYHASTYEIALYDKVKDLEQASKYGDKRGIETDYGCMDDLFADKRKPEVLRLEVRLTSRKIPPLFKTLGFTQDCKLNDLFNASLSRAVLLHYWQTITNGLYLMNIDTKDIERLVHTVRAAFPKKRPGKIMELIGFIAACQNLGVRGARLALGMKNHQWYKLKADTKVLENSKTCPRFLILKGIKQQLGSGPIKRIH